MNLFCVDCRKIFQVSEEVAASGRVSCPLCGKEYSVPEETVFPGMVVGGDFLIESFIGKGGMGDIYLAKQISLDRQVALKILQEKYTDDAEYVDGLFHEARAAAKVSHPNIVQAYAVGEENGIFYFAMEYIRGETFKQILHREKKISPERALKVMREIASAIDAAWREQRLVHQDIKPDNIMLDANGFAKLADLGLARKAGYNDEHAQAGDEVLGTPQYISPEQLTGVPTDVRSDIYSLGATFYQLVTGRYAYVADTVEEMSRKHVDGNLEAPNTVNPDIPDSVNSIIIKMMARRIDERYQTPQELIEDIDVALRENQKKKSPPSVSLKLKKNTISGSKDRASAGTSDVKKAAPVAPVAPSGVKKSEPEKTAPAAENASAEKEKAAESDTDKKEEISSAAAGSEQQSVRSALIAKHNDAEADAEEKEELEEIIAETSAPKKKSKKVLLITLISGGSVVLLLLAALILLFFCAEKEWMPAFAKPYGVKLQGMSKDIIVKLKSKSKSPAEKKSAVKKDVPAKKAPETRKEFIEKVEKFLSLYHNSPDRKKEWHDAMQPELEYFQSAQTETERRRVKPLLLIWHRIDDLIIFEPYRKKAQAVRLERIRKIEEKEQLAREAEERRLKEEQERKSAERARLEEERKKIELERQQHLAKLKQEIQVLITPLANGVVVILQGGGDSQYISALSNIKQHPLPLAENNEEQKAIDEYKRYLSAIQKCIADFKKFLADVSDVSDKGITIRVRIGNRRQLVQMLGITADGVLKYMPYGGKAAETSLREQRGISLSVPLKVIKTLKNVDFYVMLLSGRPKKELLAKAPSSEWKLLLSKVAL